MNTRAVSKAHVPPSTWREVCLAWVLADAPSLHVIQERMPPGTFELRHLHRRTWQFYFVLEGLATIDHDGLQEVLAPGEGVEIPAGTVHRIRNDAASDDVEFLLISTGRPREDRIDLEHA